MTFGTEAASMDALKEKVSGCLASGVGLMVALISPLFTCLSSLMRRVMT